MNKPLPQHIAFIVDGNRRWAKARGLTPLAGHQKVANEVFDQLVFHARKRDIPYITFWVFSTENWKRGKGFVRPLMQLFRQVIERNVEEFKRQEIRLKTIGDLSRLPKDIVKKIRQREKESQDLNKLTVTIALNYGGRDEIIRAIHTLADQDPTRLATLTEQNFGSYLDTADLPDPDMIVRTSGEQRLSGFLLWQSQYAELFFPDTLFPDFGPNDLDALIKQFQDRDRRFGGDSV